MVAGGNLKGSNHWAQALTTGATMPLSAAGQPAKNPQALHGALLGGSVMIALVFGYLIYGGTGPLIEDAAIIGYVLAAVAFMGQAAALTVLRQRVRPRPSGQRVADYWAADDNLTPAMLLWVLLEGTTMIALVGWLLSGNLAALGAALTGIVFQVLQRPSVLAGE